MVNNHINNINGEDLLFILIFRKDVDIYKSVSRVIKEDELLIPPQIVGKEYWTRGYFYNVNHYDEGTKIKDFGFYSVGKGKFFDEYGKELVNQPRLLGTYVVSTVYGIAKEVNQELIISGII